LPLRAIGVQAVPLEGIGFQRWERADTGANCASGHLNFQITHANACIARVREGQLEAGGLEPPRHAVARIVQRKRGPDNRHPLPDTLVVDIDKGALYAAAPLASPVRHL
jgi:hypothetical protein